MIKHSAIALTAAFAIAACAEPSTPEPAAEGEAAMPAVEQPAPIADAATPDAPSTLAIPAAFHGRWGMVAADCDPARDDAKGLITVSANEIRYYESAAKPARLTQNNASMVKGMFAFTGEGMDWEREMTLTLEGDRLTVDDVGEDTAPEPEVRTKCA